MDAGTTDPRGWLKIEVEARPTTKSGSGGSNATGFHSNWDVDIRISGRTPDCPDGFSWEDDINIEDPFSDAEHVEVEDYLNESLRRNNFNGTKATRISSNLDRYRQRLFEHFGRLNVIRDKMYDKVEIHIYDHGENSKLSAPDRRSRSLSIHSLQWEHLEELSLWPTASPHGVSAVTVRRRIGIMAPKHHMSLARDYPAHWKGRVNILLVVARRGVYESRPEDYSNPATIQCALLHLQAGLRRKGRPLRIHVEVVRPGSFKELEAHLTRRDSQHGPNYFQIVHFDLHGGVLDSGEAILEFNEYDTDHKLTSRMCRAHLIAELLAAHRIGCAILGACKSAQADADVHANMSWTLIKDGKASNVLAMSFNMPDSMSEKFFKSFYLEFLLEGREFGEAASIARHQLFGDRKRRHYNLKRDFEIQDWFVPVVYSNGRRMSLGENLAQETPSWTWLGYSWTWLAYSWTWPGYFAAVASVAYLIAIQWFRVKFQLSTLLLATLSCPPFWWVRQSRQQDQESQLSKRLDSDRLALNILRVEGDLKRANAIFFYCPDEIRKTVTPFLDGLVEVWKRTQFVERHMVVHAEWFLETGNVVLLRHGWRWLFNNACHNVMKPCAEMHKSKEPKSVVIIKNINVLYPERAALTENHLNARNRMFAWLEANFGEELQGKRPYLVVVVGGKRYWDERKIGQTCQVLRSAARTEFATRYN